MNKLFIFFVLIVISCSELAGAVIYSSGPPDGLGGSAMTDFYQADDFSIVSNTSLTGIRFWNLEASVADYAGSIFWYIFSDNAGLPGTALFSGSAAPTRTAAGTALGLNVFQNDFALSVSLGAGTYWLVLHNGDPVTNNAFTDYYWATADFTGNTTNRGAEQSITPPDPNWASNGLEHAFEVFGDVTVPEPATYMLVGLGLAWLYRLKIQRR